MHISTICLAALSNVRLEQPAIASLLVALLAALTIVLGLYPQLFLGPVSSVAQAFALF